MWDGDTIKLGNIEIRLNGLTCDERGTDLGDGATVYIRSKALGKKAICPLNGERHYDRLVGRCAAEDLRDIGTHLFTQQLSGRCESYDTTGYYGEAQRRAGPYQGVTPSYCASNQ